VAENIAGCTVDETPEYSHIPVLPTLGLDSEQTPMRSLPEEKQKLQRAFASFTSFLLAKTKAIEFVPTP
jgi:hypothetical protein